MRARVRLHVGNWELVKTRLPPVTSTSSPSKELRRGERTQILMHSKCTYRARAYSQEPGYGRACA